MKLTNVLTMTLAIFLFFGVSQSLLAQTSFDGKTCVGTWKTIDDESGKARSHVQIYEQNGKYYGKIIKLLNRTPDEDQDPICNVCPGDRKGKKVIGMAIISDMKKESNRYAQGEIMDPKSGKVYSCTMWLTYKNTLKVRGWVAMFYRTQTWYRID